MSRTPYPGPVQSPSGPSMMTSHQKRPSSESVGNREPSSSSRVASPLTRRSFVSSVHASSIGQPWLTGVHAPPPGSECTCENPLGVDGGGDASCAATAAPQVPGTPRWLHSRPTSCASKSPSLQHGRVRQSLDAVPAAIVWATPQSLPPTRDATGRRCRVVDMTYQQADFRDQQQADGPDPDVLVGERSK